MDSRIVEINGVKVEVDLRTAKTIETFKVGDSVKVLVKAYSNYESYPGVIIGFDEFKNLPTIVVAYIKTGYSDAEIKMAYLNTESKDIEICATNKHDIFMEKSTIIECMDRKILQKEQEVMDLKMKKNYFMNMFGKHFRE